MVDDLVMFANPFLICEQCGRRVEGFWRPPRSHNVPCGHTAGTHSTCPSWSPVNGCTCRDVLGDVPHPPAE